MIPTRDEIEMPVQIQLPFSTSNAFSGLSEGPTSEARSSQHRSLTTICLTTCISASDGPELKELKFVIDIAHAGTPFHIPPFVDPTLNLEYVADVPCLRCNKQNQACAT